jgi:D-beta-D-heptose 7-phosphate kinase / D-beta-D-heptose 1-phosphate adenosyltransferase
MRNSMNFDFTKSRVLVIGDVILDKYYYGKVNRISPEAPVPVIKVVKEKHTPGGSGNVVSNISGLGAKAFHISLTGKDENAEILEQILATPNIKNKFVASGKPTITKIRVIGEHQQVARLDFEEMHDIGKLIITNIKSAFSKALTKSGTVVISDYGKGLCTTEICQYVINESNKRKIPVIVDPKGYNWEKYKNATLITPNVKELGEAVGREVPNGDSVIEKFGRQIMTKYSLGNLLVTRSGKGMTLITKDIIHHIPTRAIEVFDVSGAGDTVVAAIAVGLASGLSITESADIANRAAGIVVGKFGTASIEIDELIQSFHDGSESKILSLKTLTDLLKHLKNKNKRIEFIAVRDNAINLKIVNTLKRSKDKADILIAGIAIGNSSGNNTSEISGIIASFECVDYVTVLDEKSLRDVSKLIKVK